MIRKSIEPETKVFNEIYGIGIFKKWTEYGDAIVEYLIHNKSVNFLIPRKNLTEIENETFNPPI